MKLKVAVVLAVLFGLVASPSFAQGMMTGGVKAGLNFANLSFDPDEGEDFKSKTGIAAGAFASFPITDMISFQPEVLFTQKGAKLDEGGFESKISLTLIEIPMLAHADFMTSGSVKPFINVGPALGLRMSAKATFKGQGIDEEDDLKDETKSIDFSVIIGGGVKVGKAIIEARYDLGLTNLNNDDDDDQKVKTRALSVLVGFGFGGG